MVQVRSRYTHAAVTHIPIAPVDLLKREMMEIFAIAETEKVEGPRAH